MSVQVRYAARSDVGLVRSTNQDSGYAGPHLLVLADGMGGPAGGDIASSVAVAHLAALDDDVHNADDLLDRLRESVEAAHGDLMERSAGDPDLAGMGTTCTAILRSNNKLAMVHIGDSRAYLLRAGSLNQVTTDHTFVQFLVDSGRLTPEEAEEHPQRNVILRALGDTAGEVELDESVREARPGDRWLLASDGLFGVVSAETIAETLAGTEDPGRCADHLIALALRAGGPDNITCVVADVLSTDGGTPSTVPQVVGAAATDRLRRSRGGRSAAARAAALLSPVTADRDGEELGPRSRLRRWVWSGVAVLILLAVLAGGVVEGYRWTQRQYYVAPDQGMVAIFRGIPQEVGPLHLARVHERTGIAVDDLMGVAQDRLSAPITSSSLEDAERTVENLRAYLRTDGGGTD
ncbi:protein phosphatase 2C domain-containing protein [Georgenia sp. 10Sc9-8]|uniref:Protein phosphatase 2C domain-containing protein n=1 Tax=Georgenia halotolerans TaxID=3028317 RepID=A0ABT5TZ07_9MICO|nr:protein phosphatase 2C domain-containing protein [Georgenia halotolerans]